jgi:heptaprenyl diphosphate synthase
VVTSDTASPRRVTGPREHLDAVAVVIEESIRSSDPIVDTACNHLVRAGGKGVRPLVSVLAATAVGEVTPRTHVAAASCELLHLSTLYHDDVIDDADLRRGAPSVNRAWGERVAVLAGNRLTAMALEAAGRAGGSIPAVVASTYRQLVEGEHRETQLLGCTDHGLADYLAVIDGKTASLIGAAAHVGALSTDARPGHVDGLAAWGRTVGQAYQVADDLLDLTATSASTGKPAGHDVRQGVFTLPLLDALTGPDGDELRGLLTGGAPYPPAIVERVLDLVRASGALVRAATLIDELLARADEHLAALPAGPARRALRDLARSVVPNPGGAPGPATDTVGTASPSPPVPVDEPPLTVFQPEPA